jgi:hypothetical protein
MARNRLQFWVWNLGHFVLFWVFLRTQIEFKQIHISSVRNPHSIIGIKLWYWKQRRNEIQLSIRFIQLYA